MLNVLVFDFSEGETLAKVVANIKEVATRLGEIDDVVVTAVPSATCFVLKNLTWNPYLVVRCDDLDSAERFAKALAELGYDVEFERVHFIHAKKNPSS